MFYSTFNGVKHDLSLVLYCFTSDEYFNLNAFTLYSKFNRVIKLILDFV